MNRSCGHGVSVRMCNSMHEAVMVEVSQFCVAFWCLVPIFHEFSKCLFGFEFTKNYSRSYA